MAEELFRPWLWRPPEGGVIGKRRVRRRDGYDKASGRAMYTRDIYRPGMLYAKVLESPYPHAKIKNMDTKKAEALPGVRAVFRYDDPNIPWFDLCRSRFEACKAVESYARWYPQPVGAVVVADSELICDEALRLIEIEWEVLPFILDWNKALEPDTPAIFPHLNPKNNLYEELVEQYGDVEAGLAASPNVIDVQFDDDEDVWAGIEGGVGVAEFKEDGPELWYHGQQMVPFYVPAGLLKWQGRVPGFTAAFPWLKASMLLCHMHFPYNGGTFYSGSHAADETAYHAILESKLTGRPVKYLYDRTHFRGSGEEKGRYKMRIGFKDDGSVVAVKYHTIQCAALVDQINKIYKGSKVPNLYVTKTYAYTNGGWYCCYKHGAQAVACMTEVFNQVAAALKMDPTEVALINDGCYGHDMAWVNENVKKVEGREPIRDSLKEILAVGKAAIDWDNKWHQPGTKTLPNGNYHGIGFTWTIGWSNGAGRLLVGIRMLHDGTATLLGQSCDTGFCRDTPNAQAVADEIGLKFEDVHAHSFEYTGFELKEPGGSGGLVGNLVSLVGVARKMKQLILERAVTPVSATTPALFPNKKPEELDIKDSVIFEKTKPDNKLPVATLASKFTSDLFVYEYPPAITAKMYTMGRQCYFMEVEVDPDTGKCHVKKVVTVYDAGKVINPDSCDGQMYGGTYMGVGRSNTEQVIWDPQEGVKLNDNLIGYPIALMNDIEEGVDSHLLETGLGYTAYGAYGIGEPAGACVSSLTRYAVHNAIGKWVDLKTTPDKILKALGKA